MMTRFEQIYIEDGQVRTQLSLETDAVTLEDMVQAFEDFLRGAGYAFPLTSHLDFVEEDTLPVE